MTIQRSFCLSAAHGRLSQGFGGSPARTDALLVVCPRLPRTRSTGRTTADPIRKARKDAKDDKRASIRETVAKLIGAVTAEFGPDSPEVVECVPQGRTIFSTSTDDQVSNHLQVLIDGITAHQAQLGTPLVTKATALKTAWDTVYAASEAASGAKTTTEEGKQMAREALQLMLHLNLVKLMELFPRQPEKLSLYMTQSLLEVPGSDEEEEEPPPAPPTPPTP